MLRRKGIFPAFAEKSKMFSIKVYVKILGSIGIFAEKDGKGFASGSAFTIKTPNLFLTLSIFVV
jgi:hypothetical protein